MIVMRMTNKYSKEKKISENIPFNCFSCKSTLTDQRSKESEAVTKLPQKNVCLEYLSTAQNSNRDFWLQASFRDISPAAFRIQTWVFNLKNEGKKESKSLEQQIEFPANLHSASQL